MKHTFKKEDPKSFEIRPEGPYLLDVIKADKTLSTGAKTRGCDQIEMTIRFAERGGTFFETLTFPNENTDPETADFLNNKINTFLCSCSFGAEEGEEIEISPETVVGLRGWGHVVIDEYQGKKKNKLKFWYTDRPKFPRQAQPAPAAAENSEPDWD